MTREPTTDRRPAAPASRRTPPRTGRRLSALSVAGLGLLTGCGSSLLGSTSSTGVTSSSTTPGGTSSTTVPVNGEVAVAFPVIACTDPAYGGSAIKASSGWNPTIILAPVPTSLVGKVTFYTDGVHTLLAPSGWTCALVQQDSSGQGTSTTTTTSANGDSTTTTIQLGVPTSGQGAAIGAQGATTLAVYPSNDPNPPTTGPPAPGTEGVFATWATTGSNAGVDLVCPFFAIPSWQSQSAGCSTTKPSGELTNALTPDVTAVADPAGVVGSLAASGGQAVASGVVLFPQIPSAISYGSPIAVAAESCVLSNPSLCPTVLSDFEVREFPTPK
ncbi:MAG TPA: hypothetical protein VII96_06495 [Acidimicrobiales bacterium]